MEKYELQLYSSFLSSKHQRGPVKRFLELVLVRMITSQLVGAAGGGGDGEGGGGGGDGGEKGNKKDGGGGDGHGGGLWYVSGVGGGAGGGKSLLKARSYGTPAAAYASRVAWKAVLLANGTISDVMDPSALRWILAKPPPYSSGDMRLLYERMSIAAETD